MKPLKKHIPSFGFSLLMLICFVLCNISARQMPVQAHTAFLRNQAGSWSLQDGRRWKASLEDSENIYRFTLWDQDRVQAENPELARSAALTLLKLSGPSNLVLPSGQGLNESDYDGCLISHGAARSLFGSEQVQGRTVRIGTRDLEIRAILQSSTDLLAVQIPPGSKDSFHSLALDYGQEQWRNAVQNFTTGNGIDGFNAYSLEGFYSLARMIIFLPGLLALLGILLPVLKLLRGQRHYPLRFFPGILLLILGICCFWELFPSPLLISPNLLPSQWSNISFYTGLISQWRETIQLFFTMEKYVPDLAVLEPFVSCLGWSAASMLLYPLGIRRISMNSERLLVAGILLTWVTLLILLILLPGTAPVILENHGTIFLLPCYFTFRFLTDKFEKKIP